MSIAAKHFDPVLGIDIHIIQPPGPVPPVPIPHPVIGILIDPMDYAPYIGATVKINGMPRGQAGTAGQMIPPHIPIGGVFVKPPANEIEVFMGSSTVCVDGDAQSHLGLPALSCNDIGIPGPPRPKGSPPKSLVLPTSVVLSVPMGPPVLIGGPPTISLMALGMRGLMAGLGAAFRKLRAMQRGSRRWKALADRLHSASNGVMDRLGIQSQRARNRVHRAICSVTGHPVDVATGKVFTEEVDFEIAGTLPFVFERVWYSTSTYQGPLGHGWHHSYDLELTFDEQVIGVRLADGRGAVFPRLARGDSYYNRAEGLTLIHEPGCYVLRESEGVEYRFAPVGGPNYGLIELRDRNGNKTRFGHDSAGRLTQLDDCEGRRFRFVLDELGRIVAIVGPHPIEDQAELCLARFAYSGEGDLIAVWDAVGAAMAYSYDQHLLTLEQRRTGVAFEFRWDSKGPGARCVYTRGSGGIYEVELEYDDDARTTRATDARGTKIYRWTPLGVVREEIDPQGSAWLFEHDDQARLVLEVDSLGFTRSYEYDERGNLIGETDEGSATTRWVYDEHDRLVEQIAPDDARETFVYDPRGNLIATTDALGNTWRYELDERGRIIDAIDPLGQLTRWNYRDDGRELLCIDALGLRRRVVYDRLGRTLQVEDGSGLLRRDHRDGEGRLVAAQHAGGLTEQFELDQAGNALRYWRGARVTEQWFGTHKNVHTARRDALGRVERLAYDFQENLVARSDRKGRLIERSYGVNDRLERTRWWDGRESRYEHDPRSRIIASYDASGTKTEYALTPQGWVREIRYADGTTKTLDIDASGRVAAIVTPKHTIEREFDPAGRLIREQQDDIEVRWRYDALGRVVARSIAGNEATFVRDVRGRVVELHTADRVVCKLDYDERNRVCRRQLEQGELGELREYDPGGQLVRQQLVGPTYSPIIDRAYTWDLSGRLVQRDDARRPSLTAEYDAVGRLQAVERGRTRTSLELDLEDNLTRWTEPLEYDAIDRLIRCGTDRFAYDQLGRVIAKIDADGNTTRFEWDAEGRLVALERANGERCTYRYDGLGRRVAKLVEGRETRYVWDGAQLIAEIREGRLIQYLRTGELAPLLARVEGPLEGPAQIILHAFTDQVGAPLELVDGQGQLHWWAELDVWGRTIEERGTLELDLRLPGQWLDRESGLHYNYSRYYDPRCGRYISPDPVGDAAGTNVYAYSPNPLLAIDPWGLAVTWYDTDGNPVPPNTTGAYRFETDAQGRTISAEGPVQRRPTSTRGATIDPPGKRPGDANGHLIGHTLGGPSVPENYVAQNAEINNSRYQSAEGFVRRADDAGSTVRMRVEPTYRGNSARPSGIDVVVNVDGVDYRNPRASDWRNGPKKRRARIPNPCG